VAAVIPLKLPAPLFGTLAQLVPNGAAAVGAAAELDLEADGEAALDAEAEPDGEVPPEPQAAAPRLRPAATTAAAITRDFIWSSPVDVRTPSKRTAA
jgi:hypothetical protein